MGSKTILCEDCADEIAAKEASGAINITCTPIAGRDGFCTLSFEFPTRSRRKPTASAKRAGKKPSASKSKRASKPKRRS